MKNLALHWKIIIGLVLGLIYGIISASNGWGTFTTNWIAPFGTIFINLLKLIAVPLVFASLVLGVASLSDTKKLSRIGGKNNFNIFIYYIDICYNWTFSSEFFKAWEPDSRTDEN